MNATLTGIALMDARIVDLVTFRRDGTPVRTPVLSTPRGGDLLIRTHHTAGKLKRLRRNPAVEVTPCDGRGRHLGAVERGTATILPEVQTAECLSLLHYRHGLIGRGSTFLRHLFGRDVFIEVRLA
ncbi:MAG TPA: PPOX class F420-dependent oxidoreductase [Verrucomicrobiae bacterium]|nr:PPOX class F420-dependent oxidoreductase [Verrucomicrobiae bacterium]